MKHHIIKLLIGAFGTALVIMFRDMPQLPGLSHIGYWWPSAVVFVVSGGFLTIIWQIGDENPWRSFYFGITWPALISLLTLAR
jgi:hypothetical protein